MWFLTYLTFISSSNALKFVEIQWNNTQKILTEANFMKFPQEDEFCDLTVGVCDNLCCFDKDCTEFQKLTFDCNGTMNPREGMELSCESGKSPSWVTFFCYTNENSPYLGMFYPKMDVIQDLDQLKRVFPKRFDRESVGVRAYKFRDPVLTFFSEEDRKLVPVMLPTAVAPGSKFCVNSAVKFMENVTSSCEQYLTKDSCEIDENLNAGTFFTPIIISNVLSMNVITSNFTFNSQELVGKVPRFNEQLQVCENVVTAVRFNFLVDGSVLKNLSVFVTLSVMGPGRVRQNFSVSFRQSRVSVDSGDRFYKRGYTVGDELQSGFLRGNGTKLWETGRLRVFKNGGDCGTSIPVTFGFNSRSSCLMTLSAMNCSTARIQLERKLNDLFTGDLLSQYRAPVEPYLDAVPILREGGNLGKWCSWDGDALELESKWLARTVQALTHVMEELCRKMDNGTCKLPDSIKLVVLFTAVPIDGRFAYRILAGNVSLSYRNFSKSDHIFLTSSVRFVQAPFQNPPRRSRFWERIFSREESSFAWLNLFHAFDGGLDGDEAEEVTFWTVVLCIAFVTFLVLARNTI